MNRRIVLISLAVLSGLALCVSLAVVSRAQSDSSSARATFEDRRHRRLMESELKDADALAALFRQQQFFWLEIMPPCDDPWVQSADPTPLPFDPDGFPKEFLEGLIPEKSHGVHV